MNYTPKLSSLNTSCIGNNCMKIRSDVFECIALRQIDKLEGDHFLCYNCLITCMNMFPLGYELL